ncbi:MAG: HAD family phosphatase [Clostridiales Family XIII bacterium]|jgi:HAD superfamily hydrolase (TIGR01509 family)|nr:HAD family phosphatase [Clostridiales Family XIII bacterium]
MCIHEITTEKASGRRSRPRDATDANAANGNRVKGLIFDMDGLMFDSERLARDAYRVVASRRGFDLPGSLVDSTMGFLCSEVKEKLQAYFDAEGIDADASDVYRERNDLVLAMVEEGGVPEKPGLRELIAYAQNMDMKLAVASASSPKRVGAFLGRSGMADVFDIVVNGGDVKKGKPDPEIFLLTAKRLGLEPKECLVLEDSENGLHSAVSAGMPAIVVPDRVQPSAEARGLAAAVLPSLSDVIAWLS